MHFGGQLQVSVGQSLIAPSRADTRATMSVRVPGGSLLLHKGVAAVLADSTRRNALAKQACEVGVQGFLADYYATPDNWTVKGSATRVLRALNSWLFSQGKVVQSGNYISSMSALILQGRQGHLFHMGDTLVFRLRGGHFEQLNRQHTTNLGGYRYPSRALGLDASLDIDYLDLTLKPGDVFLFCTQGIVGTVWPTDLLQVVRDYPNDLNQACDQLLQLAIERAGEQGYSDQSFCFQLLRVDKLPAEHTQALGELYGTLPVPSELSPGMELDDYRIEETLNTSALSRVYRVQEMATGRRLVLKTPAIQLSMDQERMRHFIMQQWVAERISSPRVAKVVYASKPRSYLYYLLEYVEGRTLRQWLRDNPQADLRRILAIVEQLVQAVRALHRRGALHQSLTMDNVLIDETGQVKLIDFGACHAQSLEDIPAALTLASRAGLNAYSAPEYFLGQTPDERADQFGVAALAYTLLTGQIPYEMDQLKALRSRADFGSLVYRPSYQANALVPIWLDSALKRALSADAQLRYPRLSDFLDDLKRPNPAYLQDVEMPLLQRNPARIWQGISAVLFLLLLWMIFRG